MLRTVMAVFGMAIALIGIILFVAIGTYIWTLKAEVNRQTSYLMTRANDAGNAANHAIDFVREVIGKAEADLAVARFHAVDFQPQQPVNPFIQMTARKASQDLAGSVERAHGAMVTASDAVVVADAALELFNEHPELKRLFGVEPTQVDATKYALWKASTELRQAKNILGVIPLAPGKCPPRNS
jgi:hydrogenase maturation protease